MRKKFSIQELSNLTGVYKRTIYFYISEKLIDPPYSKGTNAYYGEDHYYKLMLIKELRKTNLKLQSIKELILKMSFNEMQSKVNDIVSNKRENSINLFVSDLLHNNSVDNYYKQPSNISFVAEKKILPVEVYNKIDSIQKKDLTSQTNEEGKENSEFSEIDTWLKLNINSYFELNIRTDYYKKHKISINKIFQELNKIFPQEEL